MIRFVHLRIAALEPLGQELLAVNLVPLREGMTLPAFAPGAHIEVQLPVHDGRTHARCYALFQPVEELHQYRLLVGRSQPMAGADALAGGGPDAGVDAGSPPSASAWFFERATVGQTLRVSAPRAHWALADSPAEAVFVASGIGLVALLGLVRQRASAALPWRLHGHAGTFSGPPLFAEFEALASRSTPAQLVWERSAPDIDTAALLATLHPDAHLYACGPLPWLARLREQWEGRPLAQLHTQSFDAADAQRRGGCEVVLRRSGRTVAVLPGQTILEAVLAAGVAADHNCRSGHCGRCVVTVLAGEPEHRDRFLSPAERQAGQRMVICCSGARSPVLELDL